MFTENEIATMLEIPEVLEATLATKENFKSTQVEFLDIIDHDFLSLIMMTPTVGMALANGSVSLFEELALNKMARKMSRGGYFLKIDPVASAMKFLIKDYEKWELPFFEVIKVCMAHTYDLQRILEIEKSFDEVSVKSFSRELMNMPFIFVRFLTSFFLHDEIEIVDEHGISKVEYDKIVHIGHNLGIDDLHVFKCFCKTFTIK